MLTTFVINRTIEGDQEFKGSVDLRGVVVGRVDVARGAHVIIRGTVCDDLIVGPESTVELHGQVDGRVYNRGGQLVIYGRVGGDVIDEGGETKLDPKAVIGGEHRAGAISRDGEP